MKKSGATLWKELFKGKGDDDYAAVLAEFEVEITSEGEINLQVYDSLEGSGDDYPLQPAEPITRLLLGIFKELDLKGTKYIKEISELEDTYKEYTPPKDE